MSGNPRYVQDTNAIVSLLAGNRTLAERLEAAEYVGISIISYLEFLAFDGLTDADRRSFARFCERVDVVSLSLDHGELLDKALELRSRHRLKLPDAIIGATAESKASRLITNDAHFDTVASLSVDRC